MNKRSLGSDSEADQRGVAHVRVYERESIAENQGSRWNEQSGGLMKKVQRKSKRIDDC